MVIFFIDDDGIRVPVYRRIYDKGVYDISILLRSQTLGEKNLVVLIDDVESFREPVTFTGGG